MPEASMTGHNAVARPLGSPALLESLRAATHDAHEALHVHPALVDLTSASLGRDGYTHVLRKFYGFHQPFEQALGGDSVPGLDDVTVPHVTALLAADLRYWSIDPATVSLRRIDSMSVEDKIAYLYLREGSALGGQQIARNVRQVFSLGDDGAAFFSGRGRGTGPAWKAFCGRLSDLDVDAQTVAMSAARLFGALDIWLKEGRT